MKRKQQLWLTAFFIFAAFFDSYAGGDNANGKIAGKISDKSTGETLIGVTVVLEGTVIGSVTDLNGRFLISNIQPGTYNVSVRLLGFNSKVIQNVEVKPGETVEMNASLESSNRQLNEVTVTADLKKESIGSVLLIQKRSANVQDGISAEAIRKTPDKNTGDILKRVTGASVQEGKFVIVRGLLDRYNMAMINSIPLPSSEPDRKTFSFDLFPASMIDNLFIIKTASPDLPGEFAGGIIQVNTRDVPDTKFISFSAGAGVNDQTTFKKYFSGNHGKTDWLGLDNGTRTLPAEFPDKTTFIKSSPAQKYEYSRLLPNDWSIRENESASLAQSYQVAFGTRSTVLKNDLGIIGALTYNHSLKHATIERGDYDFDATKLYSYQDEQYTDNVNWGSLLNLSYKIGELNKISLKNFFSLNTDDVTILREGIDIENQQDKKATALQFTENHLWNSQIIGEHFLQSTKIKVKWYGGISRLERSVPDLRRMLYYRNIDPSSEDTSFYAYVPFGNASPNYAGKFYSALNEKMYNGGTDFLIPVKLLNAAHTIKAGLYEQYKERTFDARVLGYIIPDVASFYMNPQNLSLLPQDSIFVPENIGKNGFRIDDITNPSDHYTASSNLHAGYFMMDNIVRKKIRLVWGVRIEEFIQKLNSLGYSNDTVYVRKDDVDVLPSVNITYSLTEKINVRFAASNTVSRPEFRELAPFGFYDFNSSTSIQGNDSLVRCNITNLDLRFEMYPNAGQLVSVSGFYKHFKNPIEQIVESSGAGSRSVSYSNALGARNYGIEIEFRKNLDIFTKLTGWSQFENIWLLGNFALIDSKVDKSNDARAGNDRPMQGQSPYIINTGIQFNDSKSGIGCTMMMNRIGRRISQVGNSGYLTIYESPRNLVDIQISKRIFRKGEIKFAVNDLLRQESVFYQDRDENGIYESDKDSKITGIKSGTNYSFSMSYMF